MILVGIPKYTNGKLTLAPKNRQGVPLSSKIEALDLPRVGTPDLLPPKGAIDSDSLATNAGEGPTREIKEWQAIMDYLRELPVKSPDTLPTIPVDDRAAEIRAIKVG